MRRPEVLAAAMAALVLGQAWSSTASAQTSGLPPPQEPAPPPPPPSAAPPPSAVESPDSAPNRAVIGTGLLAIGLWYIPGAVVAARSPIPTDQSLLIPIAGPWLDLSDRPQCGFGNVSCRVEAGNEVLLVLDGLFQAWGLTTAVVGIFLKEHARVTPSVSVTPAKLGRGGYGLAAFATF